MDLPSDCTAEISLKAQQIVRVALVRFRPHLHLIARAVQRRGDPVAPVKRADRAFEDVVRAELLPDLRQRLRCSPVRHARRTPDHAEALGIDLSETDDCFFGQPVREIVLIGAGVQVLEWQDRQYGAGSGLDVRDEPVAFSLNGLDESRIIRRVAQSAADLSDHGIDAGVDVDENVSPPQPVDDLLARDELAAPVHQEHQQLHGPTLDLDAPALPSQLVGRHVELEPTESQRP
jgi:hypothetical protein